MAFAVLLFTSDIDLIGWRFNETFAASLPDFMVWEGRIYLPWQMMLYLSIGLLTLIVVSLFTKPRDEKTLDRLYTCLRTPVAREEPEVTPFTLPDGVEPAERRVLIDHPDFEIMKPSTISVVGFLVAWVAVLVLIGSFFWVLRG